MAVGCLVLTQPVGEPADEAQRGGAARVRARRGQWFSYRNDAPTLDPRTSAQSASEAAVCVLTLRSFIKRW